MVKNKQDRLNNAIEKINSYIPPLFQMGEEDGELVLYICTDAKEDGNITHVRTVAKRVFSDKNIDHKISFVLGQIALGDLAIMMEESTRAVNNKMVEIKETREEKVN